MRKVLFVTLFLLSFICLVACNDGEERLVTIKTIQYSNGDVVEITLENLIYNENGREISRKIYKNEEFYFEELYEYDSNGYLTYKKQSPAINSVMEEYYINDSAGRPIKVRTVGNINGITSEGIIEYTYDNAGRVLTEVNMTLDNTVILSVVYEYLDENGSYRRIAQSQNGTTLSSEHTLDEYGNETQQINSKGERFITHNRYDDNGNLLESVNQDKNWNTLITVLYEYDEDNRLIRESLFNSRNEKTRVIEYIYSK